jgi:hypothetical protein
VYGGQQLEIYSTEVGLQIHAKFSALESRLGKGRRAKGMIRYQWQECLPFLDRVYGGICLPQVFCVSLFSASKNVEVSFTDDVIFRRDKKGLFQLVVLLSDATDLGAIRKDLTGLDTLSGHYVLPHEVTTIIQACEVDVLPLQVGKDVYRLATLASLPHPTCSAKGDPAPQHYDLYQMRRDLHAKRFAIVRPDVFLYVACDSVEHLKNICSGIRKKLGAS